MRPDEKLHKIVSQEKHKHLRLAVIPLFILVISLSLFLFLAITFGQEEKQLSRRALNREGVYISEKIAVLLQSEVNAIRRFFYRASRKGYTSQNLMKQDASHYLEHMSSILMMKIGGSYSLDGLIFKRESISTSDAMLLIAKCRHSFEEDGNKNEFITGIKNNICIYDKKSKGFAILNLSNFKNYFDKGIAQPGLKVSIKYGDQVIYDHDGLFHKRGISDKVMTTKIPVLGKDLHIYLLPDESFLKMYQQKIPFLIDLLGIAISILLSIMVWLLQRTKVVNSGLKRSEVIMSTLIDSYPGCLVIFDLDKKILFVDKSTEQFLSVFGSDVEGKDVGTLFKQEDILTFINRYSNNILSSSFDKQQRTSEFEFFPEHEKSIPIEITLTYMELSGRTECVLCNIVNISDRKNYEENTVKQAHRTQLVYDATSAMLNIEDKDKAMQICLDYICESLNFPIGHIYVLSEDGKKMQSSCTWFLKDSNMARKFISATEETCFAKGEGMIGKVWSSRKPLWCESIHEDKGFTRVQQCPATRVRSAIGFPVLMQQEVVAVWEFFFFENRTQDEELLKSLKTMGEQIGSILERRMAQEALAAAETKNRLLLDNAGEGICGLDLYGNIMFVNPAAARMLKYRVDELIGASFHDLVHYAHADGSKYDREDSPICLALIDGSIHQVSDDVLWKKDGESFCVEYTCTPIYVKENIDGAVVLFNDITEKKKSEHIKQELISTINHELRTPLTTIQGSIWVLQNKLKDKLEAIEADILDKSYKNCQHLSELVNDILDMEKISQGMMEYHLERIDVVALSYEIIDRYGELATKYKIKFSMSSDIEQAISIVDKVRYEQALVNIISNASKFSPEGETVSIHICVKEGMIETAVKDHGPGIPLRHQNKLFQRFIQVGDSSEMKKPGTGLGLYISKAIINAFYGDITFKSKEGKGSTFFINVPLSALGDSDDT